MNQKIIKKLKKIINYENDSPEQNRVLKRLKKQYSGLSSGAKSIFLDKLQKMYNNTNH